MRTYLDCFPCFLRQGLQAVRFITDDERIQRRVLNEICKELINFPMDLTPVEMGYKVHQIIKEITGNPDPYKTQKEKYNKEALKLYPELKEIVLRSEDPLLTAIKISIAGNIIDFGAQDSFDIHETLKKVLSAPLDINDYEIFKTKLENSKTLMFIGDNAGEICFDKVLIEELRTYIKEIYFITREAPIINDITLEDAYFCGLDKICKVMSSGSKAPGTLLSQVSDKFLKLFNSVDIVIAKGQGNYETLSDVKRDIFFLLKVKCPVIARDIGAKTMDTVLKYKE